LDNNKHIEFSLDVQKDGPLNDKHIVQFRECPHFDEFYLRGADLFTVSDAKKIEFIKSVFSITIWCNVTRAAVNSLIQRPNLKELILFGLKRSGRISGFENAQNLRHFQCMYGINGNDLLEICKIPNLEKLGAQQAQITELAIAAILNKSQLTEIDFECSNFNDEFATIISQSKTITTLELGATEITNVGLEKICSMTQLKGLDLWATDVGEAEIDMLAQLPNLEYLSVGGLDKQKLTAKNVLPKLYRLPALKRVWLDGLQLTDVERKELGERFDQVILG
jgi:hypothetical protein